MLRETINETKLQFYTLVFKDMSSYIVNSLGFSRYFNCFLNELDSGSTTPRIGEHQLVEKVQRSCSCSAADAKLRVVKNFS